MSFVGIIKAGVSLAASIGVGAVVTNAVKHTTPDGVQQATKIATVIGGFVVGAMISDAASKYVEKQVDDVAEGVQKVKDSVHDAKEAYSQAAEAEHRKAQHKQGDSFVKPDTE